MSDIVVITFTRIIKFPPTYPIAVAVHQYSKVLSVCF